MSPDAWVSLFNVYPKCVPQADIISPDIYIIQEYCHHSKKQDKANNNLKELLSNVHTTNHIFKARRPGFQCKINNQIRKFLEIRSSQ